MMLGFALAPYCHEESVGELVPNWQDADFVCEGHQLENVVGHPNNSSGLDKKAFLSSSTQGLTRSDDGGGILLMQECQGAECDQLIVKLAHEALGFSKQTRCQHLTIEQMTYCSLQDRYIDVESHGIDLDPRSNNQKLDALGMYLQALEIATDGMADNKL
ncbi:unnamed protein product [Sphagnum tenellum]